MHVKLILLCCCFLSHIAIQAAENNEKLAPHTNYAGTEQESPGGLVATTAHVDPNCYIGPAVRVLDHARIEGAAHLDGQITVSEHVIISGKTRISGHVTISGNVEITDQVRISGEQIKISGNVQIGENASIRGKATIDGDASIFGRARVMDNAHVTGSTALSGTVIVKGDTVLKSGSYDKGVATPGQNTNNAQQQTQTQAQNQTQKLEPKQAYTLAIDYLDGANGKQQSDEQAFQHFKIAAEGGHTEGAFMLGDCYTLGQGTIKDLRLGTAWYKKAAEKGHAQAMYFTGMAYNYGDGVNEDQREAMRWLERAAQAKHVPALLQLAKHLEHNGQIEQARQFYQTAAALGDESATQEIQRFQANIVDKNLSKALQLRHFATSLTDLEESTTMFKAAAQEGSEAGGIQLAYAYEHALGTERNLKQAQTILEDLATQGSARAKALLAAFLSTHHPAETDRIQQLLKESIAADDVYGHYYYFILNRGAITLQMLTHFHMQRDYEHLLKILPKQKIHHTKSPTEIQAIIASAKKSEQCPIVLAQQCRHNITTGSIQLQEGLRICQMLLDQYHYAPAVPLIGHCLVMNHDQFEKAQNTGNNLHAMLLQQMAKKGHQQANKNLHADALTINHIHSGFLGYNVFLALAHAQKDPALYAQLVEQALKTAAHNKTAAAALVEHFKGTWSADAADPRRAFFYYVPSIRDHVEQLFASTKMNKTYYKVIYQDPADKFFKTVQSLQVDKTYVEELLAQSESPFLQLLYGDMLWNGRMCKKDRAKSIQYFEKASIGFPKTVAYMKKKWHIK